MGTASTPKFDGDRFNVIASKYDFLNRLLSFRQDVRWRKILSKRVLASKAGSVLDVATGTGDVAFSLVKFCPDIQQIIGVDPSSEMLKIAQKKNNSDQIQFIEGNAMALPFEDNRFDVVTISFGIRNISDFRLGLREMCRILKPRGHCFVLEFSRPSLWIRPFFLFYFRYLLPWIGGVISGQPAAYRYLNRSAEAFPSGEDFASEMTAAGFSEVTITPLSFGIATLYEGKKR